MSKSSKKSTKAVARPFQVMCTDIYLLWILVIFPLYYADGYFHLPEKKSIFWYTSTLVYVGVTLFGVLITAFSMREYWSFENFKKNISMTDVFMFGFLISNLIALVLSNDRTNSWTGASSRYYGARILILVCISYFLISRYAWMNKVFMNTFLIAGNGVCLLATFDYFGMDVLGINQQMQQWDWLIFISTMGNANTCASYVCMALAGAIVYFCIAEGTKSKIFAGVSIVNCAVTLITARSDSPFLGIGALIIIMGILAFMKKIDLKNYVFMLGLLDMGIIILTIIRKIFRSHLILESFDTGLQRALLDQQPLLMIVFVILIAVYIALVYIEKKAIKINKNVGMTLGIGIILVIVVFGAYLIFKLELIDIFRQSMEQRNGNSVGSRLYTYQRTIEGYGKLPIINKLFGCGQASMTGFLYQYFSEELSAAGISINSAHNNILDYLIMVGLFGLICYLGILVSVIKHTISSWKKNKLILVFGLIIVAYFLQGLFNIDQTNTTTIFWIIVACCEAMYRQETMKKES